MLSSPAYEIQEKIYESSKKVIYRGLRSHDEKPVILKILKAEYPTSSDIARLKHEYEVCGSLELEGVVKSYGLENFQSSIALVLEDFGGKPLKEFITPSDPSSKASAGQTGGPKKGMDIKDFLEIGLRLAEILGEIHKKNIIHKDLKPANIIVNPKTNQVKITDFGIASLLSVENQKIVNPNKMGGTLPYMSPEQTGRMNRDVDCRSDFYSLGVTFYEMLTSKLPFRSLDPMELVHCHIAKQSTPPNEVNKAIPKTVSNIVMKLLSKAAEDRYQSAYGIKMDLEECLKQWKTNLKIEDFPPGQSYVSDTFQIPQKLYGREKEVSTLATVFDRISQGSAELMLISGDPGIGKSALIQEIHKPVVRDRGYFLSGRFDRYEGNDPHASLVGAFQELIRQLITEKEAKVESWKKELLMALGPNGRIITDVIHEVELIIGKQPPAPELPSAESQNRFNKVFLDFVRVFARAEHPLVLSLDDMQWADSSSLKLIQLLISDPETKYLLVMGAYRDNEVDKTHPLLWTLDEMKKQDAVIHEISLKPLEFSHMKQLVADTLKCKEEQSKSLAELVLRKTGGNPFFIKEFLITLHQEGLLAFDSGGRCWQWDLRKIEEKGFTDNVINLMVAKIQKLPANIQETLKMAACIGNKFDLKTLCIVNEKSQAEVEPELWGLLREGLLLNISDYGYTASDLSKALGLKLPDPETIVYKFLHDRVQQAAYSMIPNDRKKKTHLKIGRLILNNTKPEELEEAIFDILKQLNFSVGLVTDPEERLKLVELNLIAGKKAKASTAYEPAMRYLTTGMDLLEENSWHTRYRLMLSLHMERAECEYLCARFEEADKFFDIILHNAQTKREKAGVYNLKMVLYTNRGENHKAVELGIEGLKLFGEAIPSKPGPINIVPELLKIILKLRKKKIEDLVHLPEMGDPDKLSVMGLLMNMTVPAYFTSQDVLALVTMKMVNMSMQYGNANVSSYAYSCFGLIIGSGFGRYKAGYEFGKLALEVSQKFNNINFMGKCHSMFGIFLNIWRSHVRTNLDFCLKAYKHSLDCGNLIFAGYSADALIFTLTVKGEPLDDLFKEAQKYLDFANRIKDYDTANFFFLTQQKVLSLQGGTNEPGSFGNDNFDEELHLEAMKKSSEQVPVSWYYINKCQTLYLFEKFAEAHEMAVESDKIINVSMGQVFVPTHYFYYSLTLVALYPNAASGEKRRYWKVLAKNQGKMKKWAQNCPENFLHQYQLVAAEMARIKGKEQEAMKLYEEAVNSARTNEFIQDDAIANELAAKFFLAKGFHVIAMAYMREARFGYLKWGATFKVKQLDEKYSQHFPGTSVSIRAGLLDTSTSSSSSSSRTSTGSESASELDLTSVIKTSQTISSEIMLEKLLARLMKIVIENAGAQKGFLILEKDGKLMVEAEGGVDKEEITVMQSIPVDSNPDLSEAVVHYVKRTRESVVLDDAAHEGRFTNDPYIKKNLPRSILCTSIIHQRKLTGILYLENNRTIGAFTEDRLKILKLLSSQIANSIENANLYAQLEDYSHTLEERVEQRTQELGEANKKLKVELVERKKAEQAMKKQRNIAEKATKLKNQFVNLVVHDLRHPFMSILGFIELMMEDKACPVPGKHMKFLDIIQKSAKSMLNMIDKLLDLGRMSSGELEVYKEFVDVQELTAGIIERVDQMAKEKEIELINEVKPGKFFADRELFGSVVHNLISNAIKFSKPKSRVVILTPEDMSTTIAVKDTGAGINEKILPNIFKQEIKTSTRGTAGEKGTGLGLPYCKAIMDAHGGSLTLEVTQGEGTVFYATLPKG